MSWLHPESAEFPDRAVAIIIPILFFVLVRWTPSWFIERLNKIIGLGAIAFLLLVVMTGISLWLISAEPFVIFWTLSIVGVIGGKILRLQSERETSPDTRMQSPPRFP